MKTSELLEHVAKHQLDDRANLLEGASDELFEDSVVLRYLNAGQRLLARDAWVIEDRATAAVCEIQLEENVLVYPLHASILHVRSARLSDTELDLTRVGYEDSRHVVSLHAFTPEHWDVNNAYTAPPGRPYRFSTDMGIRELRLDVKPDATTAALKLNLAVVRLPLAPLSMDTPDAEPEVPEEYHLDLCQYAAGSCIRNTADIDAEYRSLGKQWVNDFEEMVAKAKRDRDRLQQAPPRFRFRGWVSGHADGR